MLRTSPPQLPVFTPESYKLMGNDLKVKRVKPSLQSS